MFSLIITEGVVPIKIWTVNDSQGEVKTAEDHLGFTSATFHIPVLTAFWSINLQDLSHKLKFFLFCLSVCDRFLLIASVLQDF